MIISETNYVNRSDVAASYNIHIQLPLVFQTKVHHTLCASPPLDQGPPGPVKTNLDHVLSVTSPASPPPQWRGAPGARPCTTAAQPTRRSITHCGIIWLLLLTSGFQDQDRVQWNTSQEHLVDNCKTAPPATSWPGAARTCRGRRWWSSITPSLGSSGWPHLLTGY